MSGSGPHGAPARRSTGHGPVAVVAGAAALVALALGGQGLLVPAGPAPTLTRVGGAVVALGAVAVLVRFDGPAQGARTLALVAVAGALSGLATLPASPVSLDDPPPPVSGHEAAGAPEAGADTVLLDQTDPPAVPGAPTLEVPAGARPLIEGGAVVAEHPDGARTVLGPADHGTVVRSPEGVVVVVGDGALIEVPDPLPADPTTPDPLDDRFEVLLALLLGAFALLAFSPAAVRLARTAVDPAEVVDASPAELRRPQRMEDGLADVLRSMLADPDPRTAVIGAYARLLVALDEAGMPRRPQEGPHEHLWRALGPLGVRRAPVHRLAELFVRARFAPHPVTDAHRRAAIAALADAVADLRLRAGEVRDGDVRALLAGSAA